MKCTQKGPSQSGARPEKLYAGRFAARRDALCAHSACVASMCCRWEGCRCVSVALPYETRAAARSSSLVSFHQQASRFVKLKVEVQKPRATGAKPSDGGSFFFSVFRWTVHPQPRMKQQMSPKIRRRLGGHAPPPRLRPGSALRQVERQKLVATSTRANLLLRVVSVVLVSDSCAAQRPQ